MRQAPAPARVVLIIEEALDQEKSFEVILDDLVQMGYDEPDANRFLSEVYQARVKQSRLTGLKIIGGGFAFIVSGSSVIHLLNRLEITSIYGPVLIPICIIGGLIALPGIYKIARAKKFAKSRDDDDF